jgi:site-specific DNA-methyltransferase (adenine-specific)
MANSWKNSSDLSGASDVMTAGRWPANLVHDGSDEVVETFPLTVGVSSGTRGKGNGIIYGNGNGLNQPVFGQEVGYGDSGSAARYFQQVTIE